MTISLASSHVKNQFFGPISGGTPLGPLFLSMFFHFLLSSFLKKKVTSFLFFVFLSNIFYCWRQYQSLTVSSVVGAPWRCGVLTT